MEEACARVEQPLAPGYRPRDPESTPLHKAVREHLETFLEDMHARTERGLPRYAERELRGFLRCGVLAHGFARVRCSSCGHELLVGLSCKGRGICPSCTTRRAHDVASHLSERVLPKASYRQWVLTFPWKYRVLLARRPALVTLALKLFLRSLFAWQRRQARARGVQGRPGSVTFVQRFSTALRLNVHFHALVPDGVFDDDGTLHPLPPPTDADVQRLLERTAGRITRALEAELPQTDDDDPFGALDAASLAPRQPALSFVPPPAKKLCAALAGFSLHAATRVRASDKKALYRLCHYGARGALANSRLSELPDGRFSYQMKRALPGGKSHLTMTGTELLTRLTPLIPPPWSNLTRFHGVFAPGAKLRPLVVPAPENKRPTPPPRPPPDISGTFLEALPKRPPPPPLPARYRIPWAELLERVFGVDVLACPKCPGRMKVIALLEKPCAVRAILRHLGLRDTPLPVARSRGPPQLDFTWEA